VGWAAFTCLSQPISLSAGAFFSQVPHDRQTVFSALEYSLVEKKEITPQFK
jgi:hypothetical protein